VSNFEIEVSYLHNGIPVTLRGSTEDIAQVDQIRDELLQHIPIEKPSKPTQAQLPGLQVEQPASDALEGILTALAGRNHSQPVMAWSEGWETKRLCPRHHKPLRTSRDVGVLFCPSKTDNGFCTYEEHIDPKILSTVITRQVRRR